MEARAKAAFFILLTGTCAFATFWLWLSIGQGGKPASIFTESGSTLGVIGYSLFSLSLLLSSRLKRLESWIGGLDQIYRIHHRLGIWGFYILLIHPLFHAFNWFPTGKFFWFYFPFHGRLSVNLGSIAFWLMIIVIVSTILKLMPYDKWKILHKFMTLVFILASLHFILSRQRLGHSSGFALLLIPMAAGLIGILYKQFYLAFLFKSALYTVADVSNMTENTVLITFKPEGKGLDFIPGQYAFFAFEGNLPREQHPFTACHFHERSLSILVKARGDFTRKLYDRATAGMRAKLEGPYGRFDYRMGGNDQIWVAGGVGVAPFLAWCESLSNWAGKAVLYFCFHSEDDACIAEDFHNLKVKNPRFDYYLFCTERKERLTIQQIIDSEGNLEKKAVFLCGPRRLTRPFVEGFSQAGVKRQNIYFEDFEFF